MRRILLASILAGSAWSAHAAPASWTYTYTGFFATHATSDFDGSSTYSEGFEPDTQILGSFSGQDDDGDGVIGLAELGGFFVNGIDYFSCMANPSPYGRCSIRRFSYVAGGALDFSAGWYGYDEAVSGWSGDVITGVEVLDYSYRDRFESTRHLYWTEATRFNIVQTPVPEPAGGAMAAAGLLLLAGLGSRRMRWAPGGARP